MKRIIILIILILICGYTFTLLPKKDCDHPIIKKCIEVEVKKNRVHIVGRRFWRLPSVYCRAYLVNKNHCYWKKIKATD